MEEEAVNRRLFLTGCASLLPAEAMARAYGCCGYATKRNRRNRAKADLETSISNDGYAAYFKGESFASNPFPKGEYHDLWYSGWRWAAEYDSYSPDMKAKVDKERRELIDSIVKSFEDADRARQAKRAAERRHDFWMIGGILGAAITAGVGFIVLLETNFNKRRRVR